MLNGLPPAFVRRGKRIQAILATQSLLLIYLTLLGVVALLFVGYGLFGSGQDEVRGPPT